jgi:hypothetical protein
MALYTGEDHNGWSGEHANGVKVQRSAGWEAKQGRLAILLAQGQTIKEAAAELRIGERTAYTWLADRRFEAHVSDVRSRMLDAALGRLADSATRAVDTLVDLLENGRDSVRVRAALGILDTMTRMREHVEFERRLLALEAEHASRTDQEAVSAGTNGSGPSGDEEWD